jgi:hypothetical protein
MSVTLSFPRFLVMPDPYDGQGLNLTRGLIGEYLYTRIFFAFVPPFYEKI